MPVFTFPVKYTPRAQQASAPGSENSLGTNPAQISQSRNESAPPTLIGQHSVRNTLVTSQTQSEPDKLHFYSPSIAELLNAKQPDVAASALLHDISLWQKNNYSQTLIDGRRYAFRSLAELAHDCPYLSKSAVKKAITRLESKLGNDFIVKRDQTKLWFSIGPRILQEQKKNKRLSFCPADAVAFGIRTAVILGNFRYSFTQFENLKCDDEGNRYVRMSPTYLSKILGYSEDTVTRSLQELCHEHGVLSPHPAEPTWYTPTDLKGGGSVLTPFSENPFAEVHTLPAERHTKAAKVPSEPAKVHATVGTCINECSSQCITEDINGNYHPSRTSRRGMNLSSPTSVGLKILSDIADIRLTELRSLTPHEKLFKNVSRVSAEQLPYDLIDADANDTISLVQFASESPVDCSCFDPVDFSEWIDDRVAAMAFAWDIHRFPYDGDDIKTLEKFFALNPTIPDDTLLNLWHDTQVLVNGSVMGPPIKPRKGSFDTHYFARNSGTARAFMKNLPKIVMQEYFEYQERITNEAMKERMPYELRHLNYDYLDRPPTGEFLPPCFRPFPTIIAEHEQNPMLN